MEEIMKNNKMRLIFIVSFIFALGFIKFLIDWRNDNIYNECGFSQGDESLIHKKEYKNNTLFFESFDNSINVYNIVEFKNSFLSIYKSCTKDYIRPNYDANKIDYITPIENEIGEIVNFCLVYGWAKVNENETIHNLTGIYDDYGNWYTYWELESEVDMNKIEFTKE